MSENINERLRDKTMQIVSLNQKIETLQAQLGGSQKRANQLGQQVTQLEATIAQKDSEIQILTSELSKTKGALDTVGKQVQGMKAEQTHQLLKKTPSSEEHSIREKLKLSEQQVVRLQEDLKRFSNVAALVLNGEEKALEELRATLHEIGDPKYRILNLVLNRKSIRIEEIASSLIMDVSGAMEILDALQTAGEVEIKDGSSVIPAKKYREIRVPRDAWIAMEPDAIFESLDDFIGRTDDQGSIVNALETAVEILEQKIARGGALVFQMRRTADSWKKQMGNIEELHYTIRDWRGRANSMV
ncbi:MAG: hypothetical protein ACFFDQ_06790 [Candidatus Thorarchaeota archaeon]